jgi:diguanylate cyclase (GGDEF)-like protein
MDEAGAPRAVQRFAVFETLALRLAPDADGIAVLDASGASRFRSPTLSRPEFESRFAAVVPREGTTRAALALSTGAVLAAFNLCDEMGVRSGRLLLLLRAKTGAATTERLGVLEQALQPVLDLAGRELGRLPVEGALPTVSAAAAPEADDACIARLNELKREWGAAAVLVSLREPARRLWVPSPPPAALERIWSDLEAPLLNWTAVKREPLLFNETPGARIGAPSCRVACAPLFDEAGHPLGVFAALREAQHPAFPAQLRARLLGVGQDLMLPLKQRIDPLTGTLTRPAFQSGLEHRTATRSGSDWMLYLNVDRLHLVNLHQGFRAGDELLGRVGRMIAGRLPAPALVGRLGGDQFAALLPGMSEREARECAEALRSQVERWAPAAGGQTVRVSLSVGLAPLDPRTDTAHTLAAAEIACKAAKDRGRNRVEVFTDADQSLVQRHEDLVVVNDLTEALESGGLRLHAQGIHPTRGGSGAIGLELLARLERRDGRLLQPEEFMSAASRYQLMPQFDRVVITAAFKTLEAHAAAFLENFSFVAINLSGASLNDPAFLPFLEGALSGCRVPADRIMFEITESVASQHLEAAAKFVRAVNRLGALVALDDFGTGFSSLEHLKDLPVQYLKIDGAFVRDLQSNPRSAALVRLIIQLAQSLGLKTVAEHIENAAVWSEVAALGVDFVQGYAAGRAAPFEELLAHVALFPTATTGPGETIVLESAG